MSTHNIPFSNIKKENHAEVFPNLKPRDFSSGLKNEFETAVVNEPSVFEPLKFYCISTNFKKIFCPSYIISVVSRLTWVCPACNFIF